MIFDKLHTMIEIAKGDIVYYNNVFISKQRDTQMSHILQNNSDNNVHIVNIYLRELDRQGNKNPLWNLDEPVKNCITNDYIEDENFSNTLDEVFSIFAQKQASNTWAGLKSFTYNFKGDFKYFEECILKFKNLHDNNKGLNREKMENIYHFDEYNPVNVSEVVSGELLELLDNYYRKCIDDKMFILGDRQSQRFKAHNEPMSRFLHYEILPLIEKIVDKKLRPTYTYLSAYIEGSDLPTHTDRPDCEFTVSFLVNKDADWPIYLHKTKQPVKNKGRYDINIDKNDCLELHCQKGGLLIFSGTDHIHFREQFTGTYYNVLLLHYCSCE